MFLGHASPKLCLSVNAIVDKLCKITELRKKQNITSIQKALMILIPLNGRKSKT